ncbi:carbohydrate porin [Novosphingobium gossypii]|uniref:carbohydrate porin n=1 Tax=Novosphingobium gossypii TaxID=1604774 RepID=UPI003D1BBFDA
MSIDLPPPPPAYVLTEPNTVSQTAGAQPVAAAPVTSQQAATDRSISQQDPSTGLGCNTHVVVASPAIPANQPHLLGDWGGIRTGLEDAGITPSVQYIAMPAWNVNGGTGSKTAYTAQLTFGGKFDLGKIAGIKGGSIQGLITNRHGSNVNQTAEIGLLQFPQAVWGAGQVWRLSQMFYLQKFGASELKVGRMSVGEDFGTAPCFFESLTFCGIVPGHISPQYWYNPPVSVWGARTRIADKLGYTQVGVYELNPDNLDPQRGFNLSMSGATGALIPVERAFTVKLGGDASRSGIYKIGIWHDTSVSNDLVRDIDGNYAALTGRPAARKRGRWGGYVVVRQQLHGPDADGAGAVNVNFSGVITDGRTNLIHSIFVAGITRTGLIAGRPKDEAGIAFARTHINGRLADVQQIQYDQGITDRVPQQSEYVAEITYSFAVHPALSIRPNVQFYLHPSGRNDRPTVVVFGASAFVTL